MILQSVISAATILVSFPMIARLITPREMGIWTILLFVNQLSQTIATAGLPEAVTKYVAESFSEGKTQVAAAAFYQAIRTTLLPTCPLALAVFLGAGALSLRLLGEQAYAPLFQVLALDMLFYVGPVPVLAAAMLGLQKFKESAYIGAVSVVMNQSLIVFLLLFLRNFIGLVEAWVIADVTAAAAYFAFVLRTLGPPRFGFSLKKLLSFSWPLSLRNAVVFANLWFDRTLLAVFFPLATLGVYNATITAFNVLVGITLMMAGVLFPAYSARQGSKEDHSRDDVQRASRYVSLVTVPLALGLMVTAKPALALFVGEAYVGGAQPLMVLAAIFAFTLFGAALTPMLLALGETRTVSLIETVSVGMGLGSAFLLLRVLGMLGAALSRGISMITVTSLTVYALSRRIRIRLDLEAMAKSLAGGMVMAIAVAATEVLVYNKFLLPVYVLVGMVVYMAALRSLTAIREEDIEFITSYLGHRLAFVAHVLRRILI
jgi:O-antigen/teichoic acid export membrane protein